MSQDKLSQTGRNNTLSALAVLGVAGSDNSEEWGRIHAPIYGVLAQRAGTRMAIHILCAAIFCFLYVDFVPFYQLAIWAVIVFALVLNSFFIDRSLADVQTHNFDRRQYLRHAANAVAKGCAWAAPAFVFVPQASATINATAWSLAAVMMFAAVVSRFSAPFGSFLFCGIIALGWTGGMVLDGDIYIALAAALSGLFGTAGVVEGARGSLQARIAELGINEKNQVVSLLLREYEDSDADWLFQLDRNRRLRSVSPRLAYALGRNLNEIEGKSFIELISGKGWETGQFPPSLHELAERLKNRESFSDLIVQVVVNGERRWWELSATPMLDENGEYAGFRGVGSDVTAEQESSEKIAYLARYDTLTSLPNRLMLHEALGEALRYAEKWRSRCAFLMIDLDRFKAVNDSLGHLVGDRLLAQVAQRLKNLVGEHETCGRLGGDEFAIVIRDASDKARIAQVANAVITNLSEPYKVEDKVLYVGASVGSAIGPRDGRTVEELMRNADLALYRSKDVGGGEHFEYEPSLHASAEERRQLELSLRNALVHDELLLHYQPVVDANSEEIVSFEALVRWDSKDHGFVSPGKFIPLAEDTRLIVPIGQWVLHEACREAARWPNHVKVNINVSPEQLTEPDFAASVVRALAQTGLSPERVEIEVTESVFLRDAGIARKALEQIISLGCSVALDDFGTGYSSLGYLRKLKFSTIKVDRSFVQGASQQSAESLAIVRAVVAMADSLKMTTTAEGVETAEEADLIRNMGCTKIQGFYFGRPMPAVEARELMSRRDIRKTA